MIEICLLFEYELIIPIFDKVMPVLVKPSKIQDLLLEKSFSFSDLQTF